MSTTELIFLYVGASFVVGITAAAKGRSGLGYFALSLVLSPILIAFLLLVLPGIKPQRVLVGGELATPETHVRCPDCRELVRMDARVCKHCKVALQPIGIPPR